MALDDLRQARFEDAVAPLRAASAGLNEYSKARGRHAKDVAKVRSDLDALASSIQQDHNGAEAKIAGWTQEITRWIQPVTPPAVK